ncbi:MAG: asparagine synthase (glutamine-hydrolyzing), partial [Bacteroidetes bacterium]
MCGIVGIINKNQVPVQPDLLKMMGDTLHHRGPDDEGMYLDHKIGFFHKRLSIIDLATGQQPMTDGAYTLIFNGEIYNYLELRQELVQKGHVFKTHSDTEVILKMYREYGEQAISQLNGMFAFLLYDRNQQRVLAARDHFGIKPLYIFEDGEKMIFASEIKAIVAHPQVKAELAQESLNEYLTFQFILQEDTLFKGVRKLLPGHFLVIDLQDNTSRLQKYWEPNFKVDNHHSLEYFVYEIQRLLEDAVKIQLRSDVPLGTYLSGGMDSSIVSILASRHIPQGLKTFTGAFREGQAYDETPYAEVVA